MAVFVTFCLGGFAYTMPHADYDEVIANQPVVIDNGSGLIKAGIAGEETAKCIFPSLIGRPKHQRVMAGADEAEVLVGSRAEKSRGLLKLRYAMRNGMVEDWNDMELIWAHVFSDLKINSEEHPVLLTEAPLNPRANREKSAEIFFETFNSPAFFVSTQAILALYASGRTTGVVLDAGDGVTHVVPVYEGFAINHGIRRADVGGRDVTYQLATLLRKAGHIFHTSAEMEIVKDIKESACFVLFNPTEQPMEVQYPLPDGSQITLGNERSRAPEVLFAPSMVGLEYPGLHDLLITAINRSDLDLRKDLYTKILLSGGSTMFNGFGDRLLNEVRKLAPKDVKIRISAPPDRQISTWMGGSILASLGSFKKMWVSRQEFEEEGPTVLHRKTFS